MDIAGEYFERTEFYRGAVGCMLVYDVTKDKTLQQLATWLNMCKSTIPNAGLLVEDKIDIGFRFPQKWGEIFARYANAPHLTASAQNGDNVESVFNQLAQRSIETITPVP